jgi:vanillate/4-hydroxybenzoate decarboxylase subunit D
MRCVRCLADTAAVVAHAPDGSGAWEIYSCSRCNYAWRSSEPESITDPEKRDPFFQLDGVDLDELGSPLPIPPLVG